MYHFYEITIIILLVVECWLIWKGHEQAERESLAIKDILLGIGKTIKKNQHPPYC